MVAEAIRISQPSYSLKKVEAFYMDQRDTSVTDGGDSMIEFERWLATGEEGILERIADYNRDDCLSTWRLRDWLLERREEAERRFRVEIEWFEAPEPDGGEAAHPLGERQTVSPNPGVFLEEAPLLRHLQSRSERIKADGPIAGAGLRWLAVEHDGDSQDSPEEADRIAAAVAPLLGGASYIDGEGAARELRPSDILAITPYEAQARCLEGRLPDGVRVGTVESTRGERGAVVFFSIATSGGEKKPPGFRFVRYQMSAVISRAGCMAVLVVDPGLLETSASSIEEMRSLNALCRLVERAQPVSG